MPPAHRHEDPLSRRELFRLERLTNELVDALRRLAATYGSDTRADGASWTDVGEAFGVGCKGPAAGPSAVQDAEQCARTR
jgi:hypothetical protein